MDPKREQRSTQIPKQMLKNKTGEIWSWPRSPGGGRRSMGEGGCQIMPRASGCIYILDVYIQREWDRERRGKACIEPIRMNIYMSTNVWTMDWEDQGRKPFFLFFVFSKTILCVSMAEGFLSGCYVVVVVIVGQSKGTRRGSSGRGFPAARFLAAAKISYFEIDWKL